MLKATIHRLGRWYLGQILESEAESQKARAINERPIELAFLFQALSDLRPARVLDVGPGTSPLPAVLHGCGCHVTAIDNISDYWPRGMFNRYWHVIDEDIRTTEPCSTNGWPRRLQRVLYGKTIGSFGVATCGVRATGSRTRLERQPTDPTNLLAH